MAGPQQNYLGALAELFGAPKPGLSLGRPNVSFPNKRPLPPGVGVGLLSPQRRSLGQTIEDKTGAGLRAAGLSNQDANRWAGKLFGAFNDLTPLGNATGADEGQRTLRKGISKGDARTAGLGLASLLLSVAPWPSSVKKLGEKGLVNMLGKLAKDDLGAIRAWHGSPHDFDKFEWSPRTRGTGEGAQAYGDGLYFAENPEVARQYRDNLTLQRPSANMETAVNKSLWSEIHALEAAKAKGVGRHGGEWNDDWERRLASTMAEAGPPPGRLYEVNINAEPEDFLDWDRPIGSQPVAQRLGATEPWRGNSNGMPGDLFYKSMGGGNGLTAPRDYKQVATQKLFDAGIPGIRFLDQGSRGAGNGTSNYVVFDDKLIDILNKFGGR